MPLSPKLRKNLEIVFTNKSLAASLANAVDATAPTTAAMNLYVDVAGSDSNPGTPSAPFRTIQAAVDSLPKVIRHPVVINVGAGNFAGAVISGFVVGLASADLTNVGYLSIKGTMIAPTLTTGTASGTATGGTAGGNGVLATLTDSAQTWTTNELRGKLLTITGGTGATTTPVMITGNTATTISVPRFLNGTPNGTSTYTITDFGSVINTAVPTRSIGFTGATNAGRGFYITNNLCQDSSTGGNIVLDRLKVSTATNGALEFDSMVSLRWCYMSAPTGATTIQHRTPGILTTFGCYVTGSTTSVLCVAGGNGVGGSVYFSDSMLHSGTYAMLASGLSARSDLCYFLGQQTACLAPNMFGEVRFVTTSSNFDGTGSASGSAFISTPTAIDYRNTVLSMNGGVVSNWVTALDLSGPLAVLTTSGTITGSGNTTALKLTKGATAQLVSTYSVTGTTEINIDGTSNTLATMRAASPKALPLAGTNVYGTVVYE